MLGYAESNPSFRKKRLDTYHALPFAVQARADMQFGSSVPDFPLVSSLQAPPLSILVTGLKDKPGTPG